MRFKWVSIIGLFLFLSSGLKAAQVNVKRMTNNAVMVCTHSESIIKKEYASFYSWGKKLGSINPRKDPGAKAKYGRLNGKFCFRLDQILPPKLLATIDYSPLMTGPNCWNSCLTTITGSSSFRYSHDSEMTAFMNSPLCREVPQHLPPQPGDIIAIRERIGGKAKEVHGFVYLTMNSSFTKNGFSESSQYEFLPALDIYRVYGLTDPNCIRRQTGAVQSCRKWSTVFRCRSIENYLGNIQLEHDDRNLWKNLGQVEDDLFKMTMFDYRTDKVHKFEQLLLNTQRNAKHWYQYGNFVEKILWNKIVSLLNQTKLIKEWKAARQKYNWHLNFNQLTLEEVFKNSSAPRSVKLTWQKLVSLEYELIVFFFTETTTNPSKFKILENNFYKIKNGLKSLEKKSHLYRALVKKIQVTQVIFNRMAKYAN